MEKRIRIHPLSGFLRIAWFLWQPQKSPREKPQWGGQGHFPRSKQMLTNTKMQKAVRVAMAPEQPARHIQQRERAGDRVRGWAGTGSATLPPTETALPDNCTQISCQKKWVPSLRKQIWGGNEKHKLWLLQHKVGDEILLSLDVCQGCWNTRAFPNTTLFWAAQALLDTLLHNKGSPSHQGHASSRLISLWALNNAREPKVCPPISWQAFSGDSSAQHSQCHDTNWQLPVARKLHSCQLSLVSSSGW